jgi:uncharacterized protein YecT (DUF1311 family)
MTERISQLILVILLCAPLASAQNSDDPHPAGCEQYKSISIPAADLPSAGDRKELASCVSQDLYFGFEKPADPVRARKCAYLEREKAKKGVEDGVFSGAGLLAMIYANGKGAARNFDLALKFSCEVDGAQAENEGRFEHLLKLKSQHWTGSDFSLCDDITSGFMMGWCAHLEERGNKVQRRRRLGQLTARWGPAEKRALSELQAVAVRYFETTSSREGDPGTGRAAFEIEERASLEDGFVQDLEKFEKGRLPQFSPADFTQADAKLNAVYAKLRALPPPPQDIDPGMITFAGIKETQRVWLEYREAWVKFGRQKYPRVPAESWRTWLTQDRTKTLEEVGQLMQ